MVTTTSLSETTEVTDLSYGIVPVQAISGGKLEGEKWLLRAHKFRTSLPPGLEAQLYSKLSESPH